jgi:hypothetical protein
MLSNNAIKPVPPTLGGALRMDQEQLIDFMRKKKLCPAGRGCKPNAIKLRVRKKDKSVFFILYYKLSV